MLAIWLLAVAQATTPNIFHDPHRFPIGVWLQSPENAKRYKDAGINFYIGLWQGPTEQQLRDLRAAGMPVICDQNAIGLAHRGDPEILGWTQQDEPDNAQPSGNGYGPCVPPANVVAKFRELKAADPSRPVVLNLGQGVANDDWVGRGSGASLSDYQTYVGGGDIVSYDIYPVSSYSKQPSEDYLWLVPKGVDRLQSWVHGAKPTWNCLECTGVDSGKKPTPDQVKAELWMSVIHGSRGIVYFAHEFKPAFKEAALLQDSAMLAAVTKMNAQLQGLASVINLGKVGRTIRVSSLKPSVGVDTLELSYGGATYLFAVGMANEPTTATFSVPSGRSAEVLGEGRSVQIDGGRFAEEFSPYAVHLYRIR